MLRSHGESLNGSVLYPTACEPASSRPAIRCRPQESPAAFRTGPLVTGQFDKLGLPLLKDDRHNGTEEAIFSGFQGEVALEAIRGELTMAQLVSKHGVHQTMISAWRKQAIEGMAASFPVDRCRYQGFHGWKGPLDEHIVHPAALAVAEIRMRLSPRFRDRQRGQGRDRTLDRLLQYPTPTCRARGTYTGRGIQAKGGQTVFGGVN